MAEADAEDGLLAEQARGWCRRRSRPRPGRRGRSRGRCRRAAGRARRARSTCAGTTVSAAPRVDEAAQDVALDAEVEDDDVVRRRRAARRRRPARRGPRSSGTAPSASRARTRSRPFMSGASRARAEQRLGRARSRWRRSASPWSRRWRVSLRVSTSRDADDAVPREVRVERLLRAPARRDRARVAHDEARDARARRRPPRCRSR